MCVNEYLKESISFLKDLSVLTASGVAVYGIHSWRSQIIYKKQHDLAEEVLIAFYEAQEAFTFIRSPLSHSSEGKTRLRRDSETESESDILNQAFVLFERYEKNKAPFQKLRTLQWKYKAIFPGRSLESFVKFHQIVSKVLSTNKIYFDRKIGGTRQYYTQDLLDRELKRREEMESIFWSDIGEVDEIKVQIDNAVSEIESICFEILQK